MRKLLIGENRVATGSFPTTILWPMHHRDLQDPQDKRSQSWLSFSCKGGLVQLRLRGKPMETSFVRRVSHLVRVFGSGTPDGSLFAAANHWR
jgi:hypothetical protein